MTQIPRDHWSRRDAPWSCHQHPATVPCRPTIPFCLPAPLLLPMELDNLRIPQLKMDYAANAAKLFSFFLKWGVWEFLAILEQTKNKTCIGIFFFFPQHERINRGLIHNVNIHNAACGVTESHEHSCPSRPSAALLWAFSDIETRHGAPLKPAVKAGNDINRTLHTELIYAVSCLEQVGEEEGRTSPAACWVSLLTTDCFHWESAVTASGLTFQLRYHVSNTLGNPWIT